MTPHDYLASLRKQWIVIVALTVLGALAGYGYAQLQPNVYRSEASVMVIPARGDNTSELVQGSNYVQNLVQTYAVVATSPTVLGPVIERLDLDATPQSLASSVSVESSLNTVVLEIAVQNRDAEMAQDIADAVADELAIAVRDLSPQNADEQPAVRIQTIAEARLPLFPISPNTRLMVILGAIAGLVLGVAYALLRQLFATRLATHSDITAVTDTPILGDVFVTPAGRSLPSTIRIDPTGAVAESVRSFVAGLRFSNVDGETKVLLITSANSGDGKSSVSVATALIMAEQARSVLLIDADLRRASVARLTQLEGSVGLTSVLVGEVALADAVQRWGSDSIDVLTSGTLPPNPGQLLTSGHLRRVIETAREQYDYIIIDSPPVLAVSDPLWLAPLADGIVVVIRARSTKRDGLARTIAALDTTRTRVLGIVFNGVKRVQNSPYYESDSRRSARKRGSTGAARQP